MKDAITFLAELGVAVVLVRLAGLRWKDAGWSTLGKIIPTAGLVLTGAWFLESLARELLADKPMMVMVLIVPVLEETLRWFLVRVLELETCALGTLAGSVMGVFETVFVIARGGTGQPTLLFRTLGTLPLHCFAGGLVAREVTFLPLNTACHIAFNGGIFLAGAEGFFIALLSIGLLCGFWLAMTMTHR